MNTSIKYSAIIIFIIYILLGNIVSCASRKLIGAECCDETVSNSTSSGTCSWHGGVRKWRYEYWYSDIEEPYHSIFKYTIPGTTNSGKKCDEDE